MLDDRRKPFTCSTHLVRLGLCLPSVFSGVLLFLFLSYLCTLFLLSAPRQSHLWLLQWPCDSVTGGAVKNQCFKQPGVGRTCPCAPGSSWGWSEHVLCSTVVVSQQWCKGGSRFALCFCSLCSCFDLVLSLRVWAVASGITAAVPACLT